MRQPDGVCSRNNGTRSGVDRWSWFSECAAHSLICEDLHTARGSQARSRGIRGSWDTPAVRHNSTQHHEKAPHLHNYLTYCALLLYKTKGGVGWGVIMADRWCHEVGERVRKSVNRCTTTHSISLSILALSVFVSPPEKPSSHSQQQLLGNTHTPICISELLQGNYTQLEDETQVAKVSSEA